MRKRVAMAASLIPHPQLFLMDEPFEGVDAVGARLMKEILLDQVRHGATIFLTSHVLEVVERLCQRVAIIADGRLVLEADMTEVRAGGAETLEDAFVRLVGAERGSPAAIDWLEAMLLTHARAILWAQFRSLYNFYSRGHTGMLTFTVIMSALWYGLLAFGGFTASVVASDPKQIPLIQRSGSSVLFFMFVYWQVVPI